MGSFYHGHSPGIAFSRMLRHILVLAPVFAKLFHITDPVAEGIAIGATSHAVGTSKAMEIGELQGAMSSIALCVCGIITSVIAGFFAV